MTGLSSSSRLAAESAPDMAGEVRCPALGFGILPFVCEEKVKCYHRGNHHQCEGPSCPSFRESETPVEPSQEPAPLWLQEIEEGEPMGSGVKNPHPCPGYAGEECGEEVKYGERCKRHANQANRAKAAAEGRSHTVPAGGHKHRQVRRTPKPVEATAPEPKSEEITAPSLGERIEAAKAASALLREARVPRAHTITVTLSPDGLLKVEIAPVGSRP